MARKSKPTTRPWTALAVIGGILVLLYASLVATHTTSPKLGLDLQGGTTVTLRPHQATGSVKPTSGQINKAVDIIRARVNGLGVAEADVVKQGDFIIISVPGKNSRDVVALVGRTARLTFREVLTSTGVAAAANPSAAPSAAPSASSAPGPSAKVAPTPSASANKRVVSSALLAAPSPSPAASGTQAVTASPPPSTSSTTAPTAATDQPPASVIQQFSATLPCSTYAQQTADAADNAWVVACDRSGAAKYLLKPAKVVGTDVKGASAIIQQSNNVITGQWEVDLSFTGKGQNKFTALTKATVNKQVAVVLDGVVQSAPTIQTIIPGDAQITGNFTQKEATDLANILKYGALPITFETSQVQSVSATLGHDSLRAGLIAGGIGLVLVILYCFLYYRAMGIVTVVSLSTSALLVYGSVCALGKMIGFTLTLAGIAGLIVSIGITADSFVVFYERLKDEVREGRTARSSVDRGWVRARRTILSADTVSFLAAVVLYLLSVGSVKGFAFTLGLSTLLDVVVVFLFTKPLVSLLVRRSFFSTSRWSGLTAVAESGALARKAAGGSIASTATTKEA